jgi:hypothetical protein
MTQPNSEQPWIYTARYSNRTIAASGLTAIRITLGAPRFRLPYSIAETDKRFAPSREIFHTHDRAIFEVAMRGQLDRELGDQALEVLRGYDEAHGTNGLVLLCFEDLRKPGVWCHRQIVAAWIEERFGMVVPELPEAEA